MKKDFEINDYRKYRWFLTSSKKLVVGGKSAEQNEEVIRTFSKNPKYVVMHTKRPGSPFAIILDDNPTKEDMDETAIFTACFSKGWKEGRKEMMVDMFLMEQLVKKPNMKVGTFGVIDTIDHKPVNLKLYLTTQNNVLRAVPFETKKSIAIVPGKIKKEIFAEQLAVKLDTSTQEVIEALPTGASDFSITVTSNKKKTSKKKTTKKSTKKNTKKRK